MSETNADETDRSGKHKMHVTVHMFVDIDPDRVDEWARANFDVENESIHITDLTRGSGLGAPIIYDEGPDPTTLAEKTLMGDPDA